VAPRTHRPLARASKFIADAMLGSLARKLRIFGFDTVYFERGDDEVIQRTAQSQDRVILTSDESLYHSARRLGLGAILVKGRTDSARLQSLLGQAGPLMAGALLGPFASRCTLCNGELEMIPKADAGRLRVPPKVLARHRLFFRCTSCSKMYWRGKHWGRLRRLAYHVRTKTLT